MLVVMIKIMMLMMILMTALLMIIFAPLPRGCVVLVSTATQVDHGTLLSPLSAE